MIKLKAHQKISFSRDLKRTIVFQAILVFAFAQTLVGVQQSVGATIITLLVFTAITAPLFLAANPELLKVLRNNRRQSLKQFIVLIGSLFVLTGLYAVTTNQLSGVYLAMSAVWFIIALLMIVLSGSKTFPSLFDYLFILLAWLPVQFAVFANVTLPAVQPFVQPFAIISVLFLLFAYPVLRQFNIGYSFNLKWDDYRIVVLNLLLYFFIAIIISVLGGFLTITDRMPSLGQTTLQLIRIFYLIAIPEELLFRGVIYRTLVKHFEGRSYAVGKALVISSVVFGLSRAFHPIAPTININFGSLGVWQMPLANMLLTTVAGFFYGLVFIRTKKIFAAAVIHLLVEWIWLVFFNG